MMRSANRRVSSCLLKAEGEAYANAMLRDVALEVDSEPQPLTLADSLFPRSLDMEAGMGTIHLAGGRGGVGGRPWRPYALLLER